MIVARAVPAAIPGTATRLSDLSRSGELAVSDVLLNGVYALHPSITLSP
ncbi:hypothetical protein ACFYO2_41795 [Streptomyces sp. NPDC006602]